MITHCVLCEVWKESLYIIYINFSLYSMKWHVINKWQLQKVLRLISIQQHSGREVEAYSCRMSRYQCSLHTAELLSFLQTRRHNRGYARKFQHGKWIILNCRLTLNFETNLQNQQQILHMILEGVWQTHNVRVHGIWLVLQVQSWIRITGEQTVQWPACKEQGQSAKGAEDCSLYHMALMITKVCTVSYATNDCIGVHCIIYSTNDCSGRWNFLRYLPHNHQHEPEDATCLTTYHTTK